MLKKIDKPKKEMKSHYLPFGEKGIEANKGSEIPAWAREMQSAGVQNDIPAWMLEGHPGNAKNAPGHQKEKFQKLFDGLISLLKNDP
ncbi:MAG: hypothetical protein M0C28_15830 [Candidatus Moduliflexus flocculans]|nr:hypothetical protein [Candidatus Moduliflexus flocculans]